MSQAIYVTAKLGIADLLANGSQSAATLAAATRSGRAVHCSVLLRTLSSVGVLSQAGKDQIALSRLAEPFGATSRDLSRDSDPAIGEIHYQKH